MTSRLTDGQIIALYSHWSEEAYAAGFMHADEWIVRKFRAWLDLLVDGVGAEGRPLEDYEIAMLDFYRAQESQQADEDAELENYDPRDANSPGVW